MIASTSLNIDHHISSAGCGIVNIVDPTAAATAELLVLFQRQAGLPLNKEAAVCLLTGIITDTSSFQFTNTTARTMEVAAALLQAGAVPEPIVQHIYRSHPLSQLRFQAKAIDNAKVAWDRWLIRGDIPQRPRCKRRGRFRKWTTTSRV